MVEWFPVSLSQEQLLPTRAAVQIQKLDRLWLEDAGACLRSSSTCLRLNDAAAGSTNVCDSDPAERRTGSSLRLRLAFVSEGTKREETGNRQLCPRVACLGLLNEHSAPTLTSQQTRTFKTRKHRVTTAAYHGTLINLKSKTRPPKTTPLNDLTKVSHQANTADRSRRQPSGARNALRLVVLTCMHTKQTLPIQTSNSAHLLCTSMYSSVSSTISSCNSSSITSSSVITPITRSSRVGRALCRVETNFIVRASRTSFATLTCGPTNPDHPSPFEHLKGPQT